MQYRVEVHTSGDPEGSWSSNNLRYDTPEEAVAYAKGLFMRWTAVVYWQVVDDEDTLIDTNQKED